MATHNDANSLYDVKASPISAILTVNAAIEKLFIDGQIEQCVRECYIADLKTWTNKKKLISGTDQLIAVSLVLSIGTLLYHRIFTVFRILTSRSK